jgi:hypothetical protein
MEYIIKYKNLEQKTEDIDISKWKIADNYDIIFHGTLFKLSRDVTKKFIDFFKKILYFRRRYSILFLYKKIYYMAFFDDMDKVKIFITTNIRDISQLKPLMTEIWNINFEFTDIRYSNSFEIGKTIVLETNDNAIQLHGSKRYITLPSISKGQKWFQYINDIIENNKNIIVNIYEKKNKI